MGRKVLLAVTCWLTLSQALGEPKNEKKDSAVALDNESAESAPRLYHRGPLTVYASAVPYNSHQFKGHSVIAAAASRNIPVKASSNRGLTNLKDSYGKYVQTYQSAYTPTYPQQFVPLQDLPPHLAQPLVSAAAPSFNFKAAPNFFYGPHSYKIQELQLPVTHTAQFGSISQPLVYVNDLKSFAPSNVHTAHELHTPEHKLTITSLHSNQPSQNLNHQTHQSNHQTHQSNHQTQESNHQTYPNQAPNLSNQPTQHLNQPTQHSNQPTHHSNHQTYASTFQRLYEHPTSQHVTSFIKDTNQQGSHHQPGQIQAAPVQTSITAIVNGKKTVINLETQPPVPLLNLDLLEPLKFDNPLVPQIQHFLPKVKGATYHKLPSYNAKKGKNDNKEIIVTKTMSYDSGLAKGKSYSEPKKYNKPQTPKQKKSSKPGISVKGHPNGGDYSYEINTPNHKEVYNEQVIKYNKETNMKPVEYSYNEQTHKEPEVYTFVHSSKEPLKVTHVEYNSENDGPKHIVYNLTPEEKDEEPSNKVNQPASEEEDEDSGEDSSESGDDDSPPNSHYKSPKHEHNSHHESPKYEQHNEHNSHPESPRYPQNNEHYSHHESPKYQQHNEHRNHREPPRHPQHNEQNSHRESPKYQHHNEHNIHHESSKYPPQNEHNSPTPNHHEQQVVHRAPAKEYYHSSEYHSESPKQPPQQTYYVKNQASSPPKPLHENVFIVQEAPNFHVNHDGPIGPLILHESPRPHAPYHDSHHLTVEHRGQEYKQKHTPQEGEHQVIINKSHLPQGFSQPLYQPITPEYEEDIRILPTHKPHAAPIKVDPSQHLPNGPTAQTFVSFNPPNDVSREGKSISPQQGHDATPQNHGPQHPHVQEKSRRIIIQENQETPDEKHMHTEQVMAEMLDREENSEEDFEKAYKESAIGFPAYEEVAEDIEKDIFDPDNYGTPRYHTAYNIDSNPFQQYQKEDDKFPKFARLAYKDSRDNNQEDYFLEYGAHKPESYTDRMKSKLEYYKMFKKNKPARDFFGDDENKKEQKSAKFTLAPSFDFFTPSGPKAKQSKNVLVKYKLAAPIKYEYNYGQEAPRDNSAFASRPTYNRFKTHFVEPQIQYGFEPITAPLLYAESEMAAVASNNKPESETPGTRKKVYRENWYMKKTSTDSKPS